MGEIAVNLGMVTVLLTTLAIFNWLWR